MTISMAGDEACDALIVGSGAAGLCAAITAAEAGLDVIVAEKCDEFGGTSAWSGGWLWIPRNPLAKRAGIEECPEAPRRYLRALLGNRASDPRLEVFLENGPRMVSYLEEIGAMNWQDGNRVPDFYAHDGAVEGGRSVTAAPFDGRRLGSLLPRLRPPRDILTIGGMAVASGADLQHFFNATRSPASLFHVLKRFARHGRDLITHRRSTHLVGGNALVAHLLEAASSRGVRLWSNSELTELCQSEDNVTGAMIRRDGKSLQIMARRGVVLASGGFPHDAARQAALFPQAERYGHHSAAPQSNTGDGMRIGEGIGAEVDTSIAEPAAWAPVSLVPDGKGGVQHFPHLVDRAKPGFLAVDRQGSRFVNEAGSYHDFIRTLQDVTPEGTPPECWLICDHRAQRQFGIGWAKPFPFPVGPYLRSGYLRRGQTIAELAQQCGLPASALEKTIQRFNEFAKQGNDLDFGRGAIAYNRVQGWAYHDGPNPSLGPLNKAPYYAVKIVPGSLGTFAGLRTGPTGDVLRADGQPIPGLFAIGNDASSVMAGHYPSGGITLGPGMTFGYVVGRTLAGLPVAGLPEPTPKQTPATETSAAPYPNAKERT